MKRKYFNHLNDFRIRRNGNMFLWGLFSMIMLFAMSAVFMLYINMSQVSNKAEDIVETVAKTRAQAIDVPLKEQFGHIEVFHKDYNNQGFYDKENYNNSVHSDEAIYSKAKYLPHKDGVRSNEKAPGYDQAVLKEDNPAYQRAVKKADDIAKETAIMSFKNRIKHYKKSGSDKSFLNANENDFCIKVFPLPSDPDGKVTKDKIDLECTTNNGHTIKTTKEVNGLDNPLHYKENPIQGDNHKRLQVFNAVFVGFAYEDKNGLFYKFLKDMLDIDRDPPVRKIAKVVYPQIDTDYNQSDDWS